MRRSIQYGILSSLFGLLASCGGGGMTTDASDTAPYDAGGGNDVQDTGGGFNDVNTDTTTMCDFTPTEIQRGCLHLGQVCSTGMVTCADGVTTINATCRCTTEAMMMQYWQCSMYCPSDAGTTDAATDAVTDTGATE